MNRGLLVVSMVAISMLWIVAEVQASQVDLSSGSSFATGYQRINGKGLGSCSKHFSLDVSFKNEEKWSAVDNHGNRYVGKYKQSKELDGRKITAVFSSSSKRKLEKHIKHFIKKCADVRKVSVEIDEIRLEVTVKPGYERLRLHCKVTVDHDARGEKGKALWKFKTLGSLLLSGG